MAYYVKKQGGGKRKSYFEELRTKTQKPNGEVALPFEKMSERERSQAAFRIIRDIIYDNINDVDYVYFKNAMIINSCKDTAIKQMKEAYTKKMALEYYNREVLRRRRPMPFYDANYAEELANSESLLFIESRREAIWHQVFLLLDAIIQGQDPMLACGIFRKQMGPQDANFI